MPGALHVVVDDEDLDVGDVLTGATFRIRRARRVALSTGLGIGPGTGRLRGRAGGQLTGLFQDPANGSLQVLRAPESGDGDRQPAHTLFLPACTLLRRLRGRPYSRTCTPSAPTTMPSPPREETS